MARPYNIGELRYSLESSPAENINDLSSNSFTTRIPTQGPPIVTATQERIENESMHNYSTERSPGYNGPRRCSIEFTTEWPGYMATTASGSLTSHWAISLLGLGLGTSNAGDTGTDIDTGAGTPDADTIYTTANPADFAEGSVLFVGSKGDGYGDGAAAVVDSVSTQTVELKTALPGSAQDTDVVYASIQVGILENYNLGSNTVRFICSHLDTGAQMQLLGCHMSGLTFNIPVGGKPTITWRYEGMFWDFYAETTPSAVAMSDSLCAPWVGGDVFFQTHGTTTRNTISASGMSLDIQIPLIPHETVGGDHSEQIITGWSRGVPLVEASFTVMGWENTYDTLFDSDGSASTYKHILAQSCSTDGRRTGFYLPKCFIVGNRPTKENVNEVTGVSFRMRGTRDSAAGTNVAKSPVILFFG